MHGMIHASRPRARRSEWRATLWMLTRLLLLVLALRSFVFAPFVIPSESMLPRLFVGDFLIVSKFSYGFSRYSTPVAVPLWHGRLPAVLPARGDVAVFKAPPDSTRDFVKRVIGLPGDTVQMVHGRIILNGAAVPQRRVGDFEIPMSGNYHCSGDFAATDTSQSVCRYRQYRETLPNGKSYTVIDRGATPADDTPLFTVPAGHVFMMGDNRDDSADSRFPAIAGQGIGYVPLENLEGPAAFIFFSTDGDARWWAPWSWFTATRWRRIGGRF